MTPAELRAMLNGAPKPILLDIREHKERVFWIPTSLHIPMRDLPGRLSELDKEHDIVVLCQKGVRSQQVADYLVRMGFPKVHNLIGGMDAFAIQEAFIE